MIRLERMDAKNVWDIIDLEVAESQRGFVAANCDSMIEAYTANGTGCSAFPFGIYDDETPVGFLMIGFNEAALDEIHAENVPKVLRNNYSLWRLMIAEEYQNKGFGREAIRLALEFIRSWPCGKAEYCVLSYEPENVIARKLYHSFGFVENGELDGDEIVEVLRL